MRWQSSKQSVLTWGVVIIVVIITSFLQISITSIHRVLLKKKKPKKWNKSRNTTYNSWKCNLQVKHLSWHLVSFFRRLKLSQVFFTIIDGRCIGNTSFLHQTFLYSLYFFLIRTITFPTIRFLWFLVVLISCNGHWKHHSKKKKKISQGSW